MVIQPPFAGGTGTVRSELRDLPSFRRSMLRLLQVPPLFRLVARQTVPRLLHGTLVRGQGLFQGSRSSATGPLSASSSFLFVSSSACVSANRAVRWTKLDVKGVEVLFSNLQLLQAFPLFSKGAKAGHPTLQAQVGRPSSSPTGQAPTRPSATSPSLTWHRRPRWPFSSSTTR